MEATVQDNGNRSIPKVICEALGMHPGAVIELHEQAGTLVARKKSEPDVFEKWRGRGQLPSGNVADAYLRLARDGERS